MRENEKMKKDNKLVDEEKKYNMEWGWRADKKETEKEGGKERGRWRILEWQM